MSLYFILLWLTHTLSDDRDRFGKPAKAGITELLGSFSRKFANWCLVSRRGLFIGITRHLADRSEMFLNTESTHIFDMVCQKSITKCKSSRRPLWDPITFDPAIEFWFPAGFGILFSVLSNAGIGPRSDESTFSNRDFGFFRGCDFQVFFWQNPLGDRADSIHWYYLYNRNNFPQDLI